MNKVFLINSGHGGFVDGKYTTYPEKMYKHQDGLVAYEGVINRNIKEKLLTALLMHGLPYIDICGSNLDIPLSLRVQSVNEYSKYYGKDKCILIDLHSNAGGGSGFEIWTSPGYTKSDIYASMIYNKFAQVFPEIERRNGKTSNNPGPDKEALFMMLTETYCPAVLPEFLFFDNYEDYSMIVSPNMQYRYANLIADVCKEIDRKNI